MAERQPIPIRDPQHTPQEGGNGSPGIPSTIHERAEPPPESAEGNAPVSPVEQKGETTRSLVERLSERFGLPSLEEIGKRIKETGSLYEPGYKPEDHNITAIFNGRRKKSISRRKRQF